MQKSRKLNIEIEHQAILFLFQFLSHPVVYNLLEKRWRGRFAALKSNHLKWALIRLWCLVDLFIFPFLFVILFIVHSFKNWRRKYKGVSCSFGDSTLLAANLESTAVFSRLLIQRVLFVITRFVTGHISRTIYDREIQKCKFTETLCSIFVLRKNALLASLSTNQK